MHSLIAFSLTATSIVGLTGGQAVPLSSFPQCAQTCITSALATTPCTSFGDLQCVCKNSIFNNAVGGCEAQTCSNADLYETVGLANENCQSVGGFTPVASSIISSIFGSVPTAMPTVVPPPTNNTAGIPGPTVTPFPGGAQRGRPDAVYFGSILGFLGLLFA